MRDDRTAALKPGAIERVLETDRVTLATRRAIEARLAGPSEAAPQCFAAEGFSTLAAVCDRLIPQADGPRRIDLARRLDARLAQGPGDGWRYDVMPSDREAITAGITGVDQASRSAFGQAFVKLGPNRQDEILAAVQTGSVKGDIWATLPPKRFFEELLAALTEIYFSHPYAQEEIGYIGMADAEGFHTLGLNARDPVEQEASLAAL